MLWGFGGDKLRLISARAYLLVRPIIRHSWTPGLPEGCSRFEILFILLSKPILNPATMNYPVVPLIDLILLFYKKMLLF